MIREVISRRGGVKALQDEETDRKLGKGMLKGALALSVAALIAKALSAGYRIPYQNMAGDLGYYVYQQVYPFYGLIVIVAMYGFPVVISRQVAEQQARGDDEAVKRIVATSFYSLLLFSLLAMTLFAVLAPTIAVLIGDLNLVKLLRTVSLTFLLLPFLSVVRAITKGIRKCCRRLSPMLANSLSAWPESCYSRFYCYSKVRAPTEPDLGLCTARWPAEW